jgi:hypothetical protein
MSKAVSRLEFCKSYTASMIKTSDFKKLNYFEALNIPFVSGRKLKHSSYNQDCNCDCACVTAVEIKN